MDDTSSSPMPDRLDLRADPSEPFGRLERAILWFSAREYRPRWWDERSAALGYAGLALTAGVCLVPAVGGWTIFRHRPAADGATRMAVDALALVLTLAVGAGFGGLLVALTSIVVLPLFVALGLVGCLIGAAAGIRRDRLVIGELLDRLTRWLGVAMNLPGGDGN